jgi:hypothetical protein
VDKRLCDDLFCNKAMSPENIRSKAGSAELREKQTTFSRNRRSDVVDDPVNRRLLSLLREDGRATYAEIGKRAHLAAPAAYERIRRLESAGFIQKHTVTIDPAAVGLPFCAFIRIGTAGDHGCDMRSSSSGRAVTKRRFHVPPANGILDFSSEFEISIAQGNSRTPRFESA